MRSSRSRASRRLGLRTSAPISIFAGGLSGALIAYAARRPILRMADPLRSRYGVVAALFGLTLLGPAGLALYLLYPDWCLMYVANPRHQPAVATAVSMFLLHAGAPVAGFLVMHRLFVRERARSMLIAVPVLGLLVGFGWERLASVAYYEAFHGGAPRIALSDSPLAIILAVLAVVWLGSLGFTLFTVRRHVILSELLPIRTAPPEGGSAIAASGGEGATASALGRDPR